MGCAASTGPLYRDEHDFATTAAYYDRDDDVKKDWVENEQLGEGMFARVVKITRKSTNQQYACKVLRKTTVIEDNEIKLAPTSVDTSVTSTARLRVALENDLNVRVSRAAPRARAALAKALFDRDVARRAAKVAPADRRRRPSSSRRSRRSPTPSRRGAQVPHVHPHLHRSA